MRTTNFTPEQIVAICQQGESGVPVVEVCRQHGISEQTYYRWKKQLGDISTSELKEIRQLPEGTVQAISKPLDPSFVQGPAQFQSPGAWGLLRTSLTTYSPTIADPRL